MRPVLDCGCRPRLPCRDYRGRQSTLVRSRSHCRRRARARARRKPHVHTPSRHRLQGHARTGVSRRTKRFIRWVRPFCCLLVVQSQAYRTQFQNISTIVSFGGVGSSPCGKYWVTAVCFVRPVRYALLSGSDQLSGIVGRLRRCIVDLMSRNLRRLVNSDAPSPPGSLLACLFGQIPMNSLGDLNFVKHLPWPRFRRAIWPELAAPRPAWAFVRLGSRALWPRALSCADHAHMVCGGGAMQCAPGDLRVR